MGEPAGFRTAEDAFFGPFLAPKSGCNEALSYGRGAKTNPNVLTTVRMNPS